MTLTTGQVLQNRYRIVSMLGQGGMGAVYRAWDTRLSVSVALKEMRPQPGIDPQTLAQLRQQFQQEAQILARLSHPNLVRVGDFFEEGDNIYLVMDFVEGESLATRIAREGALPETHVVTWAAQLLDALAYCHSHGVIHRDIKPQNVIIRDDGQAVLVDFGLVKLWNPYDPETRTAMRGMGTPEYAPPEQYDATIGHTDPRSDLYSLGATLYQALTGHAPPTATMRIANPGGFHPPRVLNPYISPRTEAVILRATELAVGNRFASAQEMAAALSGRIPIPALAARAQSAPLQQPQVTTAVAGTQPAPPVQKKRTSIWVWVLGGLAVVLLAVGLTAAALVALKGIGEPTPTLQAEHPTAAAVAAGTEKTATPSPSPSPTEEPTDTPSPSPTPTARPETPTPTLTPTPSPSPSPTATPSPPPPATPPPSGALFTFEEWSSWRRGDQPYGELTQTQEQVHTGNYAAKLSYDFPATEEDFVVFVHSVSLAGQPNRVGAWVYGDGSGHYLNVWVQDVQQENWSVHLGRVGGPGWQQMVGSLDPSLPWPSGHISGPDNGRIDYPVSFYALVLDRPGKGPQSGQIYIDDISVWQKSGGGATATPRPRPTATPGQAEPTSTPTSEPAQSAGSLDFPVPTYLDAWEPAEGGYLCTIVLHISGGAPPFTIKHDMETSGTTQERVYNLQFQAAGCTIIHTITVESADGQSVSHDYYINSPWCD